VQTCAFGSAPGLTAGFEEDDTAALCCTSGLFMMASISPATRGIAGRLDVCDHLTIALQ